MTVYQVQWSFQLQLLIHKYCNKHICSTWTFMSSKSIKSVTTQCTNSEVCVCSTQCLTGANDISQHLLAQMWPHFIMTLALISSLLHHFYVTCISPYSANSDTQDIKLCLHFIKQIPESRTIFTNVSCRFFINSLLPQPSAT